MNLTREEAFSLLNNWKSEQTVLRAHFSRSRITRDVQGSIQVMSATGLKLLVGAEEIEFDLWDASFNGDRRGPPNAPHGAYLICEFKNDDRVSFYAPRSEVVHHQPDRRGASK